MMTSFTITYTAIHFVKNQEEGQKNIGIISHVESIKERISTQIRLQKDSRGFSKIEIFWGIMSQKKLILEYLVPKLIIGYSLTDSQ